MHVVQIHNNDENNAERNAHNIDHPVFKVILKNVYLSIVYINYFFILAKTAVVIFHEYGEVTIISICVMFYSLFIYIY